VLFANFAEAMAEGRGKAQADALRKTRTRTMANRVREDGSLEKVSAESLRKDDVVIVSAGETIPGDGTVIFGVASVDESAITGESAPVIREAGGVPCVTRVGHSLIKEKMLETGAVFAGESSGHFFYAFPTGCYEGPVAVAAQLLQELTARGVTLSELVAPLNRYAHSGEINFTVNDKAAAIGAIKERYADGALSELDGVTIAYPDFWFNVRASNTEPLLRLNLEAADRATMETRRDEITALIRPFAS